MRHKAQLRSPGGRTRRLQLEPLESRNLLAAASDSPLEADWGGTIVHDDGGDLFAVDMKGGSPVEFLGSVPDVMSDVAFSPSGELFGLGGWPWGPSELYTVELDFDNPGGSLQSDWMGTVYEPGFSNLLLNSLEFGPDGSLYGVGYGWVYDGVFDWATDDYLYLIDTSTAVAEPVLWLGGHHSAGDLTFDEDGTGYTVTDSGTLLAIESDFSSYTEVNARYSAYWDYYGLTYGAGPNMYGFRAARDVYRINPDDATETYLGTMEHPSLGLVNGAASVYRPPTVLEDVDFLELADQTPVLGELWYRIEAAHDGILTADLPGLGSARGVDMFLYSRDAVGSLDELEAGDDRLDYFDAQAGQQYYLQITGVEAGVDVRLANLVSPTATGVHVFDTQGNDEFEYVAGSTYVVTINGLSYELKTPGVDPVEVSFAGTAGSETARLTGSSRADTIELNATTRSGSLEGPGYRVDIGTVAEIHVDGRVGNDSATITGTDGEDEITMGLKYATLTATGSLLDVSDIETIQIDAGEGEDRSTFIGSNWSELVYLYPETGLYHNNIPPDYPSTNPPDYRIETSGIETNTVTGGGPDDVASMYDTDDDDEYRAKPGEATLVGPGYSQTILGFPFVHAYAKQGGHDVAWLTDSTANEKLRATPTISYIRGGGFHNRAKFFDVVHAYSTEGGKDLAVFDDSAGDDTFDFTPTESKQEGDGYSILAEDFERVVVRASTGFDVARITTSTKHNALRARAHKVVFYGGGLDLVARRFDEVYAESPGGTDLANIHDTLGDDHLEAADDWARLSRNVGGLDLLYHLVGFANVHAYHSEGTDTTDIVNPLLYNLELRGGW